MMRYRARTSLLSTSLLLGLGTGLALTASCAGKIRGGNPTSECTGVVIDGDCVLSVSDGTSTDWHPDPDGDEVASARDVCPHVYDPEQSDADGDGVGDYCDDDFVNVAEGGPVVDLRAEHVTPYGAWFNFTSPESSLYGLDYLLVVSESRGDVESAAATSAVPAEQREVVRVYETFGAKRQQPIILTSLAPNTQYFAAVYPLGDDSSPDAKQGNVLAFKTAAAPDVPAQASRPRAWATAEQLDTLRTRAQSGDSRFTKWSQAAGSDALSSQNGSETWDFPHCHTAALLYHATGDSKYRDAALKLIDTMENHWASNELVSNSLRWADAGLGICADLMWDELSGDRHNSIVAAFLDDDEAADNSRMEDTDEFASITRAWVVDGLVACGAEGLSAELSERGCALLDRGLRAFYGVQLVKARRDQGYFAQSGGALPDGIGYGFGSSHYWMHTLHALGNAGANLDLYGRWVWHNFLSLQAYALTPMRRGYVSYGDLDQYDNFGVEPNSLPVFGGNASLVAYQMGLLERAGMREEAEHARWYLDTLFDEDNASWVTMLFDHDGITARDNSSLPTAFVDTGLEQFYDRTSWDEDASYLYFSAGWSGVDHTHADAGHFQFYRKGVWLTHENLGYDGPSSQANGHNVPLLEINYDDDPAGFDQFRFAPNGHASITASSSEKTHAFVRSDLLGAYSSGRYHSQNYSAVERHLLWIKPSEAGGEDQLFIYDLIDSDPQKVSAQRGWQMQIDGEANLDGSRATYSNGSEVQVELVLPSSAALEYLSPEGTHSQYPGEIYSGRLQATAESEESELRYLAVLQAGDSAPSKRAKSFESAEVVGAALGQDLVVFARHPGALPEGEVTAELSTTGLRRVFWTGLEPGASYSVSKSADGVRLTQGGNFEADAGGVVVANL